MRTPFGGDLDLAQTTSLSREALTECGMAESILVQNGLLFQRLRGDVEALLKVVLGFHRCRVCARLGRADPPVARANYFAHSAAPPCGTRTAHPRGILGS